MEKKEGQKSRGTISLSKERTVYRLCWIPHPDITYLLVAIIITIKTDVMVASWPHPGLLILNGPPLLRSAQRSS